MPAVVGALLVLLTGLALTLSAMLWNRNRVVAEGHRVLDAQMERLQRDVVQRFMQPVYGLKGARGRSPRCVAGSTATPSAPMCSRAIWRANFRECAASASCRA